MKKIKITHCRNSFKIL